MSEASQGDKEKAAGAPARKRPSASSVRRNLKPMTVWMSRVEAPDFIGKYRMDKYNAETAEDRKESICSISPRRHCAGSGCECEVASRHILFQRVPSSR